MYSLESSKAQALLNPDKSKVSFMVNKPLCQTSIMVIEITWPCRRQHCIVLKFLARVFSCSIQCSPERWFSARGQWMLDRIPSLEWVYSMDCLRSPLDWILSSPRKRLSQTTILTELVSYRAHLIEVASQGPLQAITDQVQLKMTMSTLRVPFQFIKPLHMCSGDISICRTDDDLNRVK